MVDTKRRGSAGTRPIPPALKAMLRASDGILDLLPIATFICDAKGTILQYNRHAVAIWGRAPERGQLHEEFRESAQFFELDGAQVARSIVPEVLATCNTAHDADRSVERADGTRLLAAPNVDSLRDVKANLVGAVNCFLDITERQRMDSALERSRMTALEQAHRLSATSRPAPIGIWEI